jgi:hypothetical protein
MRKTPQPTHKAKRPSNRSRKQTLSDYNYWIKTELPSVESPPNRVEKRSYKNANA